MLDRIMEALGNLLNVSDIPVNIMVVLAAVALAWVAYRTLGGLR